MNSQVLRDQLVALFEFQKYWFEYLIKIQTSWQLQETIDEKGGEDYSMLSQGHLVEMTCGHRGLPNRMQEKRVSRLLRKSGFIPMLDQK